MVTRVLRDLTVTLVLRALKASRARRAPRALKDQRVRTGTRV